MKSKTQKGVTLVALITTIIVLLILASVAAYSAKGVIESSKFNAFVAELKIMQTQVNALYEKVSRLQTIENNRYRSL